jgi:hypothetical protein
MRQRLTSAGLSTEQHQQLLYAEVAAVAAIAQLELHTIRPN